jgi:hypothetical protein
MSVKHKSNGSVLSNRWAAATLLAVRGLKSMRRNVIDSSSHKSGSSSTISTEGIGMRVL